MSPEASNTPASSSPQAGRGFIAPTGDGHLLLTGSFHAVPAEVDPEISLEINHLPVAMAVDGIRLVRSGFAPAVQAIGIIDGSFTYAASEPSLRPQVRGRATVNGLTMVAPEFRKPFTLPALHFTTVAAASPRLRRHAGLRQVSQPVPSIAEAALSLDPFIIGQASGLSNPLTVSGAFNRTGFTLHVRGQSPVGQIAALGSEFGLLRNRDVSLAPLGTADLDLTIHGPWLIPVAEYPVSPAALDGSVRLRNAQLTASFLAQPLEISSAQAVLGNNQIDWITASMDYGSIHGDGSLSYPAFCELPPTACAPHFALHVATLDAAAAQSALLGTIRHGELVQRLLDRIDGGDHFWPPIC